MKFTSKICITIIILSGTVLSGNLGSIQFGGFLQNRTTLTFSSEEIISDVSQARLEGSWNYGDRGGVESHVIITAGLKPLDPFETLRKGSVMDRTIMELFAPFMNALIPVSDSLDNKKSMNLPVSGDDVDRIIKFLPYSTFYPSDKVVLDRALVKAYFHRFDFYAGRQMIAWGTGYAFNPTDIWNRKSPLDPDAPKTGVNALRVEIPLGALSGISLVASPGRDIEHSSGGMRLKTNIGRFDVSVSGMRVMNADRKLLGLPKKLMAGADLAGQIGEIGVWAETAFNNPVYSGMNYTDFDSGYLQTDIGVDYTFENGLYAMLEYYYNGLGQKDRKEYGTKDLINMLAGEMAGFGRHYLFGGLRYNIANRIDLSLFSLGNLADRSVMLLPSVSFDPTDNINLELASQIGVGDRMRTEYGGIYPNLMLIVSGYF